MDRYALALMLPAALGLAASDATAQAFPSKPISFIVPYGPGTGNDVIARLIAQKASETLSRPMVVENRAGASGAIGTEAAAKAPADGHTLLMASTSQILNQFVSKVRYDMLKDFTPVTAPGSLPYVLAVPEALPAKSVKELVALAKSRPGKVNYAGSYGSLSHFMGEMLKSAGGVDIALIAYKSTPDAVADVLGNRVEIWFTTMASAVPLARTNKIRVLGTAGKQRAPVLPDVPTFAEAGFPTLDVNAWFYVLAPGATPRPVIATLHREIAKALTAADVKEKLAVAGVDAQTTTPEEASAMLKNEVALWTKVVKETGVKME
jgi:tripartite-type tricarboxylate transporter receptor subunit TctC